MATMMVNLRAAAIFQVNNQEMPQGEGPRCIPLLLDFTAADTYSVDLTDLERQTRFSMVQTVWVDLKDTDQPLTLLSRGTGQKIQIKGRTQGFYPVMASNPTVLEISCPGGPAALPVTLINVPIFMGQWATQ